MLAAGSLAPVVNATTVAVNQQVTQLSGNSLQGQLDQAQANLQAAQTKVSTAQSQLINRFKLIAASGSHWINSLKSLITN